jgi:hypothetical protein
VSRVRENRMHGSMWRREETGAQSAKPCERWRLPPTLQRPGAPRGAPALLLWQEAGVSLCAPGRRAQRGVCRSPPETLASTRERESGPARRGRLLDVNGTTVLLRSANSRRDRGPRAPRQSGLICASASSRRHARERARRRFRFSDKRAPRARGARRSRCAARDDRVVVRRRGRASPGDSRRCPRPARGSCRPACRRRRAGALAPTCWPRSGPTMPTTSQGRRDR